MQTSNTRRDFLKKTAILSAGALVGNQLIHANTVTTPNEAETSVGLYTLPLLPIATKPWSLILTRKRCRFTTQNTIRRMLII